MHEEDDFDTPKSKSQIKREMQELQELGTTLVKLPAKELAKIPLPDPLTEAIELARKITGHGGLRRQMKYIGKLMRDIDTEAIQLTMEKLRQNKQQAASEFHQVEQWRDRLIADGNEALSDFLNQHTEADRQHLRQLMLNAQKEAKLNKPPKSSRQLFRYLRDLLE